MVIELVRKEMINRRAKKTSSVYARLLKAFLKLIFYGIIVSIVSFTFTSLDNKITKYSSYGTFDFLVMFLFGAMIVGVLSTVVRARKIIFNKEDSRITMPLPISNESLIFAKGIYLYIREVFTSYIIAVPMLVCFGAVREVFPYYFIFSVFYPFIISLFTVGVSLILVVIYEYLFRVIKTSDIAQFVLASILVIVLCFIYQFILNLFLSALNDSSIGGMFSVEFIDALHNFAQFLIPVYNILNALVNNFNVLSNVFISIGLILVVLLFGFFIVSIVFHYFNVHEIDIKSNHVFEKHVKIRSPFSSLIRKEMMMLFKDSAYTFSYTALLIMMPFLSFVVISSLNGIIYKNLEFFLIYYPELINGINISLILLFMSVINSSATLSMSREGKSIQIVKYIPLSLHKQIIAKILIPMILSITSLIITLAVLLITNSISFITFIMTLFVGIILIVTSNVFGILFDMHDKSPTKVKLSSLNTIIAVGFPLIILATHFVLSLTYVNGYVIYLVESGISLILLLVCFIHVKKRFAKAFLKMEAN